MFLTIGEAVTNGFMICGFMINLMAGRSILSTYAQLIKKNAVLNAFNTMQVPKLKVHHHASIQARYRLKFGKQ